MYEDNLKGFSDDVVRRWLGSWVRISPDGGETWDEPLRVPGSAPHGPIRLESGGLLYLGKERSFTCPFDPRKALRQISNSLLQEFFRRRGQLQDVPWQDLSETRIEPIFVAWQRLPDAERQEVQVILQDIHALADQHTQGALAEQVQDEPL